jgi:hypothetical protein
MGEIIMNDHLNVYLVIGGVLSALAALLHVIIVFKGASWYRYFGAGEWMATRAEQGSWIPGILTFGIAGVLFIWGLYAFSGAGLFQPLPYLQWILVIISAIYLIRGLVLFPALLFMPKIVDGFAIWSSLVSLTFGLCYAIGTWQESFVF